MPTYDYLCPSNGRVVEVSHKMAEQVAKYQRPCDTGPCGAPACGGGGCSFD